MKYRADIDGLRALAVIPVVLFHSGLPFVGGGFVGVDVFFVISGYVITWRLYEDMKAGRFSILDFYERRIRRIMPAFCCTMLFSLVLALIFLLPPTMLDFSRSLIASSMFLSNVYFWSNSNYFDVTAQSRPLLHTWSLSVEEQFYLFIPIGMYLAYRYIGRRAAILFALVAIASFALSVYATARAPSANFFLLFTRAWELLIGSLLVLVPLAAQRKWMAEALAALGLALILYPILKYTEATPFPGVSALMPTIGAALLLYVGRDHETAASRILSLKPMLFVGLISYSLYLVHWPIAVFMRYYLLHDPNAAQIAVSVSLSFALAVLSWRYVEQPFRHSATAWPRSRLFAGTGAALLVCAMVGFIGVATNGFGFRFPGFAAIDVATSTKGSWRSGTCFLVNQPADDWKAEACTRTSGAQDNALLWGDSFAAHYVPGLVRNSDRLSANIVQYTFAGCPPLLSYESFALPNCHEFNQRVFDVIKRFEIKTVVLSTRWDLLIQRGVSGLSETVERLKSAGVDVYVIGQSPVFAFDPTVLSYRKAGLNGDGSADWFITTSPDENSRLRTFAGGAKFVDPLAQLCKEDRCPYIQGDQPLYSDYGHYSEHGSDVAVRTYFPLYNKGASAESSIAPQN